MILLAKAALGLGGTLVLAGAYTFHEGVIRIDVDEYRQGGSHVHMWVPAAVVPMTMHVVPKHHLRNASEQAREFMPFVHALIKELKRYPNADFVEVKDEEQHVQIRTHEGKLEIDVHDPGEDVHLRVPLRTLDDVAEQLEANAPGA
ncbi:MAG TPA: hypothetical protein VMH48_11500 [Methylomirabilota bacterium]|nr:hypothetical protein [Methylomirabilota bacterium]